MIVTLVLKLTARICYWLLKFDIDYYSLIHSCVLNPVSTSLINVTNHDKYSWISGKIIGKSDIGSVYLF